MSTSSAGLHGEFAQGPLEIPKRGLWQVARRVKDEMSADNISIVAAGVSFYGFLSLVPAIGVFVLVYGLLFDPGAVDRQLSPLEPLLPGAVYEILTSQLSAISAQAESNLGLGLLVSLALALWGSTKGMKALMVALNIAYEEREKRSFIRQNIVAVSFSLAAVAFMIFSLSAITAIPPLLDFMRLAEPWASLLTWLRWLILAALVVVALSFLYRFGPYRRQARWRWILPGAVLATVLWLAASMLFSFYVSNFGNYNETFGSLATVVVLLLWLYLSAFSICLGAELNAELEHQTFRDSTIGRNRPAGLRGAYVADHTAAKHRKE